MALVFKNTLAFVSVNYATHVVSSWGYHEFCVPHSVWDVMRSMVTTASPACSFLLTTMQATQTNYASLITSTLATTFVGLFKA